MEQESIYLYKVVETHDLLLGRTSYGILSKRLEDGATRDVALIPGISYDKEFVLQLLERCKRNQLSPIHMLDIVMDALP